MFFPQFREFTPLHLVRRDGIVLLPVAAGVLIEVGAGVSGFVDRGQVKALRRLGL
jgi:hypothetical protein